MIITIDGPAGVGKSTIAKLLAKKLKFSYFDTGAMYRAVTYGLLKNKINPDNEQSVLNFLKNNFNYEIKEIDSVKSYYLNNEDITQIIRSNYVTDLVSQVASKKYVRETMLPFQRKYAENKDLICEGRDMGTVIFPEADIKIYLTARISVRAERRFKELIEKFPQDIATLDRNKILQDIQQRDEKDSSREYSPLRKANDAYLIDTSNLTINQVIKKIIKKIKKRKKMKLVYRFFRFLAEVILRIFYKFKVYGLENVVKGGAIITANHVSFLDPPIIAASLEEEIHFLAKESLFKIPFFKTLIKILNTHPISEKESNIHTIRNVKHYLKQGKKILIFPEGTRAHEEKIGKLLPGAGFIINLTKSTIIPTYIHGASCVWKRNKKFPKLFGKISCVFGKPIKYEEFEKIDKNERISIILSRIEIELKNLQKWADDGFKGSIP
jgi:CMP/dCMP kinase